MAFASSDGTPNLVASPARSTWTRISGRRRASAAASSIRRNKSSESIEWMASNGRAALRALLDCRWPIRCQRASGCAAASASILGRASWTLFSPKSRWPASMAARMASRPKVLETATSRTASAARPESAAARAMRARTSARFAAMAAAGIDCVTSLRELGQERLHLLRVLPGWGELQVALERGARSRHLPGVEVRHADPVVRVRVIRLGLHRGLELRLGLGVLLGVPQHDALVEQALRAHPTRGTGRPLRRFGRHLGRFV